MEDMLIYIVYDSWSIFRPFSIFYDHFVYFVVGNWVYFFRFGTYVVPKNLATLARRAETPMA
jgi:hypothetical protein